ARDDIHALLVTHRLEWLADIALECDPWEMLVQRTTVDEIGTAAWTQDDSSDRGLALAGRLVAGTRGEIDRGARDRLGQPGALGVLLGLGLLVLIQRIRI